MKYFGMFKKISDFPPKPKNLSPEQIEQDLHDVLSDDPLLKILTDESSELSEDGNRVEQIQEVINKCATLNSRQDDVAACLSSLKSQESALEHLSSHLSTFLKAIPDSS